MTITCFSCGGSCTGEVLRVQDRHFHISCFVCKVCNSVLASGGYFMRGDDYYCSKDYHILFGTKCRTCGDFVEGRVVTALGHSYHPQCFTCDRCKSEIRSGTVVTYNDRQEILCQKCTDIALNEPEGEGGVPTLSDPNPKPISSNRSQGTTPEGTERQQVDRDDRSSRSDSYPGSSTHETSSDQFNDLFDFSKVPDVDPVTRARMGKCSGCSESIRSCQSLIALERHWHLFCFTCYRCNKLLTSEYMNKGDKPYCEPCYHELHGVLCEACQQYITGKVLEAGERQFHPTCASCCKCGLTFGEGEDMCIAGEDIWHLDCDKVRAAAGIRSDSETSSEGSRSRSRTRSATTPPLPTPSPTSSTDQRPSSKLTMSRESSAGEPDNKSPFRGRRLGMGYTTNGTKNYSRLVLQCIGVVQNILCPLKELQINGGNARLPRGINRTKLEQHLSDEDFHLAFGMERSAFYRLQSWKQVDLKKRANLF